MFMSLFFNSQICVQVTESCFNSHNCFHLFSSLATIPWPSLLFVKTLFGNSDELPWEVITRLWLKFPTKQLFLWKKCIVSLICKTTAIKIGVWNNNNRKLYASYLTIWLLISYVFCLSQSPLPAASQSEWLNWQVIFYDFQHTFVYFGTQIMVSTY